MFCICFICNLYLLAGFCEGLWSQRVGELTYGLGRLHVLGTPSERAGWVCACARDPRDGESGQAFALASIVATGTSTVTSKTPCSIVTCDIHCHLHCCRPSSQAKLHATLSQANSIVTSLPLWCIHGMYWHLPCSTPGPFLLAGKVCPRVRVHNRFRGLGQPGAGLLPP